MTATKEGATQPAAKQDSPVVAASVLRPSGNLWRRLGNANMRAWLQAKLTVSDPRDSYEQEADRVADQVMRMPDPQPVARTPVHVQRASEAPSDTPAVDAGFESSLHALGDGEQLADSVRSFMEPRFNADFSAVRVHTGTRAQELARSVSARAFTVGRNVVFGAGNYAPHSEQGKRLLAHELTHVVQQSGASPPKAVVQRDVDLHLENQVPTEEPQEARKSLDATWYIDMEPATGIVLAGTQVTFHLRNSRDLETRNWEELGDGTGRRPVFVLSDQDHHHSLSRTSMAASPMHPVSQQRLTRPGRYRATFIGRPRLDEGPAGPSRGAAVRQGAAVRVSVDFDVVNDLGQAKLDAAGVGANAARDLAHLENPEASDGEIAAAFQRLAVRHAFATLESNRKEAEEQLAMYTTGVGGKTGAQAADELKPIVDLDTTLRRYHESLKFKDNVERIAQKRGTRNLPEVQRTERERIEGLRAALVEAFPVLAVINRSGELLHHYGDNRDPKPRQPLIQEGLREVLRDIAKAKAMLANGELPILKADVILAATRNELGIDADPRMARAVDRVAKDSERAHMKRQLAAGAAQLMLLLVPGIGVYLSAGLGIAIAAHSWGEASKVGTAASAGVRGGIASNEAAAAAGFWAMLDTAFALVELGGAIGSAAARARKIVPHVRKATRRLSQRVTRTASKDAAEAARAADGLGPRLAAGGTGSRWRKPYAITAEELREVAAEVLGKPMQDWAGHVYTYKTMREFRRVWHRFQPYERTPAGFFDPVKGDIHLSPRASVHVALHEAVHKVADETFKMTDQLLGDFLNEGVTEFLASSRLRVGPMAYHRNVAFAELLQLRLGPKGAGLVRRAAMEGEYRALRDAIKQLFRGSDERTFKFFTKLRGLNAQQPDIAVIDELVVMLDEAVGIVRPPTNLRVVKPKPPRMPPRPEKAAKPAHIPEGLNLHDRRASLHAAPYSVRYPVQNVRQIELELHAGGVTERPRPPRAAAPVDISPFTTAALIRELRASGTPEGAMTADMLANGERVVRILQRDPEGAADFAGTWRYGTRDIELYADRLRTSREAAQTVARLVRLSIDNVSPEQLHRGHELAAELWGLRAIDPNIALETAEDVAAVQRGIDQRFPHLPPVEPETELPPFIDLDSLPTDVRQWHGYSGNEGLAPEDGR